MIDNKEFLIIFGVFCLLTWRDLFYAVDTSQPATPNMAVKHHKHDAILQGALDGQPKTVYEPTELNGSPNLDDISGPPTVKILFCSSCGYRHAFEEMSRMLQDKYPHFRIVGATHQPGWLRSQVTNLVSVAKMAIMGLVLFNIDPFRYFQMSTPTIWTYMQQHKIYCCLLVFLLTNSISAQLMSTGAFEIFFNDIPIWSKIETGRMPAPIELMQMIESQLSLSGTPRMKFAAGDFISP